MGEQLMAAWPMAPPTLKEEPRRTPSGAAAATPASSTSSDLLSRLPNRLFISVDVSQVLRPCRLPGRRRGSPQARSGSVPAGPTHALREDLFARGQACRIVIF